MSRGCSASLALASDQGFRSKQAAWKEGTALSVVSYVGSGGDEGRKWLGDRGKRGSLWARVSRGCGWAGDSLGSQAVSVEQLRAASVDRGQPVSKRP